MKLLILQWGKHRSIVEETYFDNGEQNILIVNNDYLMNLDDMGVIL